MGYVGDIKLLEGIMRRWTNAVAGMEELPYVRKLNRLDLFSFNGRLLRADMILMWEIFNQQCSIKVVICLLYLHSILRVVIGLKLLFLITARRYARDFSPDQLFALGSNFLQTM